MAKKVFELANELKIGALDLVELLKSKGLNVRNHMATLTEEELSMALAIAAPKSDHRSDDHEKGKKKVTRKKVTTQKSEESAPQPSKTVKVSRSAPSTSTEESSHLAEEVDSMHVEAETSHAKDTQHTEVAVEAAAVVQEEIKQETQPSEPHKPQVTTIRRQVGGLRVVSRPPPPPPAAPPVEAKTSEDHSGSRGEPKAKAENDYMRPKMHRFTPVFIPEKKVAPELPPVEEKRGGFMSEEEDRDGFANSDDDADSPNAKKKVGNLAAMMSGKAKVRDITQLRADEELKSYQALSSMGRPIFTPVKKKKIYSGPSLSPIKTSLKDSKRVIIVHRGATALDLASKLSMKFADLADEALKVSLLLKANDYLGPTLCQEVAAIFNYRVEDRAFDEEAVIAGSKEAKAPSSDYPTRAPVITIMGHVDHGKTSLLDYIRKAKVASGEAGGITQHIGAYTVKVKDSILTFLDTPGHAAFSAIRQRGAAMTDLVVLVVAADDGVMPQTVESIKFCKTAGVPIIIAVNKIDKHGVNPDKIKQQMMEHGLTPEEWGGDTQYVHVSALTGEGVDNLLECIAIQSEVMDLRANNKGAATGIVIESKVEQGRGPVATILIQEGTLEKGDSIVVGETMGRARSLMDHTGKNVDSAGPSTPIQILGLDQPPSPGDILNVVKNEREASKIVDNRIKERLEVQSVSAKAVVSLEDFFATAKDKDGNAQKLLTLVVRTDVHGSFEAIKSSLEVLGNDEVAVKVAGGGVGAITDNDVLMASGSNGFIIGFNMRPVTTARRLAEERGVQIRTYSIIYELLNDVKLALEGLLAPEYIETYLGRAEVREVFNLPKAGIIAGSAVIDGKIQRGCSIRLLRDGKILHDGKISTLKRFKDDVKEVGLGYECGIALENYSDVKSNDIFEAYLMEERKRKLEPSSHVKL